MSNHREIIDANLVKLCKLTRCNEIVLDTCTERKIITHEDKELIEKEELPYNRNRKFYAIVRLKDETNFQNLIHIMKEEDTVQSKDILNLLDSNQPGSSGRTCPRPRNSVELEQKSVWFNVQDPITSFVGREDELKELHAIVTRNADKDTQVAIMSQLSSVSGMGGIGKTTLAREYAKRYASFFNNNIIWINAETTGSTEESFRKLADKIFDQNMIVEKQNGKEVPISKVTTGAYEYLSTRKCLFVFDNVEEFKKTVAPFVPKSYEPGKIRPYILMTSRKQRLVHDCKVLRIDILAMGEAENFIKSKLQNCMGHIENESVRRLAYELQCLPLALQQAASYIQNQVHLKSFFPGKERNHIEEYLKLLEENPKIPLNHEYQNETMDDYAYTVMRTWDVTLKAIQREEYGNKAIEVFEMFAYYPPDNINIQEFEFVFSKESLERSCVILEQYSLINRVWKYINIHRLVQQVIRVQNKEEGREEYNIGRCLSVATMYTKLYHIDCDREYRGWDLYKWKLARFYEDVVIKFRTILGKNSLSANISDLEILNSALRKLEKNVTRDELIFLYYVFITSAFDKCENISEYDQGCLAEKVLTRLNSLIEMGHHDYLCNIVYYAFSCIILNPVPLICTSKCARDVIQIISKYCYEHSVEIVQRYDYTPYRLVQLWLKSKELGQCRMCFKLLVLETGAEIVNNVINKKLNHPVFENFHLFSKYLLELGIVTDEKEREFVREVLKFCRSLPLDALEIRRLAKVDILLCNILCLILLNCKSLHEILPCVFKISVLLRSKNVQFLDVELKSHDWLTFVQRFKRTIDDFVLTLNNIVIIGTTPVISSDWAHYIDKTIMITSTYVKILEIEVSPLRSDKEYLNEAFQELEYGFCELEACCRLSLDIETENLKEKALVRR